MKFLRLCALAVKKNTDFRSHYVKMVAAAAFLGMITISGFSQKKYDTLTVKTSAVCDMCQERIEGGLAYEKGVKSATLDLETKVAEVIYNPAKTSPEKLRTVISNLGYDADSVPANQTAYARLPACCKKDAPKH